MGGPAQEAPGECRSSYDVCADIADKFGKKDAFTEGKTQEDWIKELYEAGAKADGNMPTWDEIKEQGVYKRPLEPAIGLVDFRTDPVKNPLSTPSGKIEIYSETLAGIASTWELGEEDLISPIPGVHARLHRDRRAHRRVPSALQRLPLSRSHALLVGAASSCSRK